MLTSDIRLEPSLWIAWLAPLVIPIVVWAIAQSLWSKPGAKREIDAKNFRAVYVAATSVLAVVVPLTGSLVLEVRTSESSAALGLLLSAVTLAVFALVVGAYLIFKLSTLSGDTLTVEGGPGSSSAWMAIAGSVQFSCVIAFLVSALIGLSLFAVTSPNEQGSVGRDSGPARYALLRDLPEMGVTQDEVKRAWGTPDQSGEGWLLYRLANSSVTFCFVDDDLDKIIESRSEDQDAVQAPC